MNWYRMNATQLEQGLPPAVAQAEVLFVMPATDEAAAERAATLMASRAAVKEATVLVVMDNAQRGFVGIANLVFKASSGAFFGYAAQDAFAGRQWLAHALETLRATGKGLLAFNDGKWSGALAAFGLGRRQWLAQNYGGDLFHGGYTQHYADTELSVLALGNRQMAYNPQALLVEVDWEKDHKGVNALDRMLFASRKDGWIRGRVEVPQSLEVFA